MSVVLGIVPTQNELKCYTFQKLRLAAVNVFQGAALWPRAPQTLSHQGTFSWPCSEPLDETWAALIPAGRPTWSSHQLLLMSDPEYPLKHIFSRSRRAGCAGVTRSKYMKYRMWEEHFSNLDCWAALGSPAILFELHLNLLRRVTDVNIQHSPVGQYLKRPWIDTSC